MDRLAFLNLLRQSRLLSEEQLALVGRQFGPGDSADAIASKLTAAGVLTPFQVRRLKEGKGKGLVLGQYRLLEEIGGGAFGKVYKALHTVMGRVVAVKILSRQLVEETKARNWFRREVQAVTELYHPNIVMAYDANEADGVLFLVMEYVEGSDLETHVRRRGPLPAVAAVEMMRQAALALQYAHDRGLVHRDIKPGNLLVPRVPAGGSAGDPPAAVKVVDFGLARLRTSAASARSQPENGFLGTPAFVAPEQARNAAAADGRSDLYSLGSTFYYALTGRMPFGEGSVYETLYKVLEADPEPVESLRPDLPPGLAAVIRRLMAKNPADRFQTPAELAAELARVAAEEPRTPAPRQGRAPGGAPGGSEGGGRGTADLAATHATPVSVVTGPEGEDGPTGAGGDPPPAGSQDTADGSAGWATLAVAVNPVADLQLARSEAAAPGSPNTPAPPGPAADPSWSRIAAACFAPAPAVAPPDEGRPAAVVVKGADPPAPTADADEPAAPEPPEWDDGQLLADWNQWTRVVEFFARGGEEDRIDERMYSALHARLLAACRARAEEADGGDQARLRELITAVEPWMTPRALAAADLPTLASLLRRCREVEPEVFGRRPGGGALAWAGLGVCALIGAGLLFLGSRGLAVPTKATPHSVWGAVQAYPVVAIAVGFPVMVLSAIYAVARLTRR